MSKHPPADPGRPGLLDGWSLVRYTHATPAGGGVERYLGELDEVLMARNDMRIVRVGFAAGGGPPPVETIRGGSSLVEIWLPIERLSGQRRSPTALAKRALAATGLLGAVRLVARALPTRLPRRSPAPLPEWLQSGGPPDLLVVHCPGNQDASWPIEAASSRGIPVVLVNHFSNPRLDHLTIRRQAAQCLMVGTVSGQAIPPRLTTPVTVLGDGIDTEVFSPLEVHGLDREPSPLVLLPARVTPGKGHIDLIRAAGVLKRKGISLRLGMPGRWERDSARLRQEMVDLARDSGLPPLLLPGDLEGGGYREMLAKAAVVALPSQDEGLGRVLLEAQAMEKPVVAYDAGGVREAFIDQSTGFLVRKGDWQGMARRLGDIIEDPALARRMGRAGRRFIIDHFSLTELARRHESFYLAAAGEARRRGS